MLCSVLTDNLEAEVCGTGIVLGMDMAIHYYKLQQTATDN